MSNQTGVSVRFWGVRGSIACSGPGTVGYGGNTSCIEVLCDDHRVIFDAGTGIRPLGASFEAGTPVDADILLSHTHLDHIVGLPFFAPAYTPGSHLRLWAGHLPPKLELEGVLCNMMAPPLFPIPMGVMSTAAEFDAHRGWGHSTWQEGAALAQEAGVGTYVPFHHDPSHDDAFMAQVEREAQDVFANTVVAREGLIISV